MKPFLDESLSPRLVLLLRDLFPESESALQNGLARTAIKRFRTSVEAGPWRQSSHSASL